MDLYLFDKTVGGGDDAGVHLVWTWIDRKMLRYVHNSI